MNRYALCALLGTMIAFAGAAMAEGYSFEVKNTTDNKIVKLLVSEDGSKWGSFDIGKGIKPGQSVTLVWDESTDSESCEQEVKAVFDDESESEPSEFNFCESDLALEF